MSRNVSSLMDMVRDYLYYHGIDSPEIVEMEITLQAGSEDILINTDTFEDCGALDMQDREWEFEIVAIRYDGTGHLIVSILINPA